MSLGLFRSARGSSLVLVRTLPSTTSQLSRTSQSFHSSGRSSNLNQQDAPTPASSPHKRALHTPTTAHSHWSKYSHHYSRLFREAVRTSVYVLQSFFIYHLITHYIGEVRGSEGPSMLPTFFYHGDWVVLIRLPALKAYRDFKQRYLSDSSTSETEQLPFKITYSKRNRTFGLPLELGDIIVATSPTHPDRQVCKRIVGLPGDQILIDPRSTAPTASLLVQSSSDQDGPLPNLDDEVLEGYITVPQGHCFLSGDNLANSNDSRHYGPVPFGMIRGKVVARAWPSWKTYNHEGIHLLPMSDSKK